MASSTYRLQSLITVLWGDWQTNALWQRIVKCSIACTVATIIAILPSLASSSTFLTPMVTVFAHPGQRMGVMVESLILILFGSLLGLCWSLFGLYLASLTVEKNTHAAYTIRGLFLLVSVLIHGYVRSATPRLFNFVLFLLITSVMMLGLPSEATKSLFTTIFVPVLMGGAVSLAVNLAIFPELSSSCVGSSTIETLTETMDLLKSATRWFVAPGGDLVEGKRNKQHLDNSSSRKRPRTSALHPKSWRIPTKGKIHDFLTEFPNPFTDGSSKTKSSDSKNPVTLGSLTERKARLRAQLRSCKATQEEVNFELSFSSLPPSSLKPISTSYMTELVRNIVAVIGCCENKFVLIDHQVAFNEAQLANEATGIAQGQFAAQGFSTEFPHIQQAKNEENKKKKRNKHKHNHKRYSTVEMVKPIREIETGDNDLVELLISHVREPVQSFVASLKASESLLISCLAYCFDLKKLDSGAIVPSGISLEEIDIGVDCLVEAIAVFDAKSAEQLKQAALSELGQSLDFMPRMETFLLSSFILALRQGGTQVLSMLRHARGLVERRKGRLNTSNFWLPQYLNIRKLLVRRGESNHIARPVDLDRNSQAIESNLGTPLQEIDSRSAHNNNLSPKRPVDEESTTGYLTETCPASSNDSNQSNEGKKKSETAKEGVVATIRHNLADAIEWVQGSDHVDYALKLAVAVFLVSWPALVTSWASWYDEVRGIWAPLQLILVFEVAIGTSLFVFFVRLFGVAFGCIIGYLSFEIARGNRAGMVIILLFGIVPSVYIQLATKYVKAGMISVVSMAVVALGAANGTAPAYEIFYKRLVAFLVGGLVAMLVEVVITPVRARDRLVESLSSSVRQLEKMQTAVSVGVDGPERPDFRSRSMLLRFSHARDKAQNSLAAAEMFLPFCLTEPRLKGSFKPLAPIYREIIYVLHQILDRMDNVVQLRRLYGSSILEDLNAKVYAYRRNVAASSTLILFSVNEALTTWLPLPQFLPSARLSQLRLINRIRDILNTQNDEGRKGGESHHSSRAGSVDEQVADKITQRKFLSWNASAAGQMEVIEYLEELVELVKLLVGVNAFRSGMLERPNYRQYMREMETSETLLSKLSTTKSGASAARDGEQAANTEGDTAAHSGTGITRRRRAATVTQQQLGKIRSKLRGDATSEAEGEDENDEEDEVDIPASLQRVRTRLREDNSAVRRWGFPVESRGHH